MKTEERIAEEERIARNVQKRIDDPTIKLEGVEEALLVDELVNQGWPFWDPEVDEE